MWNQTYKFANDSNSRSTPERVVTAANPYDFTPDAELCVPEPRQHLADIIRTFLAGDPATAKKRYSKEFAKALGSPKKQASDPVAYIDSLFYPHLLNGAILTKKTWDHLQRLVLALESPRAVLKLEKRRRWHILQLAAFLGLAGFCYLVWLTGGEYFLASLYAAPVNSVILILHHRENRQIDPRFPRRPLEDFPEPFASAQDFELAANKSRLPQHPFPLSEDISTNSNSLSNWILRAIVMLILQPLVMLIVCFPQTDHRLTVVMGR